tara:strand:+ start:183 stop:536 length:354 start_codon:yes stop_codon:yes gene_type:complete
MTEDQIIKYQDLYLKCYIAQMKKDRQDNPRFENGSVYARNGRARSYADHGGRNTGRPRTIVRAMPSDIPLSPEATIANKLILRGFLLKEVADVLGISPKGMSRMKKKYDLPRKGEKP